MATTHGVVQIHSAPSALCPHIEWAVGGAIGLVLIEVVNRQSFHWSMDLHVPWGSLALFGGVMVALAALAAVAAGRQAMRQDAVLAVREDW